jgi:hypothetical protein
MKILIVGMLLTCFVSQAELNIAPQIFGSGGTFKLELGPVLLETLKAYNPTFKVWSDEDYSKDVKKHYKATKNQTLSAVVGDFNDDKMQDVILLGRTDANNVMVAVLSNKNGYEVFELGKTDLSDPKKNPLEIYLAYVKPKKFKSRYEDAPLVLKTEAFEKVFFAKASSLYYFKDGKFEQYITSD